MRAISPTRSSPSTSAVATRGAVGDLLLDGDLGVGDAATWARWVTTSTWWRRAERRRAPRRPPRRLAADAGVDLVEHERAGVASPRASTRRRASIVRASSPPDATLASGSGGAPGLAASRNRTSSPGSVVADRRPRGARAASPASRSCAPTAAASRGAAARRAAPTAAAAARSAAHGLGALGLELGRPRVVALQLGQPGRGLVAVGDHLGERRRRTCGAGRAAAGGAPAPPRAVRGPRRSTRPASAARRPTSASSASCRAARRVDARERRPAGDRGDPRRRARRAPRRRRRARRAAAAAGFRCAAASASASSSAPSASSSSGSSSTGGVELVDLVAQQVDLARPGALVATERGELGVDLGDPGTRRAQRLEVDAAERSSAARWVAGGEQALVGVLPCRSTSRRQLGERGDRGEAAVDVGARPAVGRDTRASTSSSSPIDEAALDPRLGRAGAHHRRVGPPADEQLDRLDEHRLAGAGLARERRSGPAPSTRSSRSMTPRSSMCSSVSTRARRQRSVRPNLAFRIWWKRRSAEAHEASGRLRRPAAHHVALAERRHAAARRRRARPGGADDLDLDRLGRIEHQRAVEQHVRRRPGSAAAPGGAATRSGRGPTASTPSTRSASPRSGRRRRSW